MIVLDRRKQSKRSGAAFLLLVVMIVLVVVGASQTMVRRELTLRRGEADRLRVDSMSAAMEAAEASNSDRLALPVNESRGERIEVSVDRQNSTITARWLKAGKVIDQMHKKLNRDAEPKE